MILFILLMIFVFLKLLKTAIKMTWSITKIIFSFVLLPFGIIGLALSGFVYLAVIFLFFTFLLSYAN